MPQHLSSWGGGDRVVDEDAVPRFRGESDEELSLSEAFTVLSEPRRRFVLYYLLDADEDTVAFGDVVDRVSEWERAADTALSSSDLAVSLYHHHLPKLDAVGLVEWDPEARKLHHPGNPLVRRWLQETRRYDFE